MIADLAWPLALSLGMLGVGGGLLLRRVRVRESRSAAIQRAWTEHIDKGGTMEGHLFECSCGQLLVTAGGTPTCSVGHEPRVMRMVAEP